MCRPTRNLVSDKDTGHVQQFTIEGRSTGKTVTTLTWPWDMDTLPDGRILARDFRAGKVLFLK